MGKHEEHQSRPKAKEAKTQMPETWRSVIMKNRQAWAAEKKHSEQTKMRMPSMKAKTQQKFQAKQI